MAPTKFKPTGTLNITADPAILGDGDMTRCLNLRLDRTGRADLRYGSTRFATQVATPIHRIIEQDGYRYTFASTSIYKDEASIETSLTSAAWSAVKYKAYLDDTNQIYATNGTDKKRIEGANVYEWGIAAPEDAPVITCVGTGARYDVFYTYAWKDGTTLIAESNPSPVGYATCTANSILTIAYTVPTDDQVTHIRFYVSYDGGGVGYYISEYAYDSTAYDYAVSQAWEVDQVAAYDAIQFTDTSTLTAKAFVFAWEEYVEDAPNGGESAISVTEDDLDSHTMHYWEQELYYIVDSGAARGVAAPTDNDRLPDDVTCLGGPVNGYLFAGVGNKVYYCSAQQPDYWPVTNYMELGSPQFPLKAIVVWNGQPYAITTNDIWQIQGSAGIFYPIPMRAKTGCLAQDCAVPVAGIGIVRVAHDGIYAWDGSNDTRISDDNFGTVFRGETSGATPSAAIAYIDNSWLLAYKDSVYFGYPETDYPDNFLVMRTRDAKTVHYTYGSTGATQFVTVAVDFENERIIAGDSDGYLWVIEDDTATTDNAVAIDWSLETKVYSDQVRRAFPRWARYDVDLGTGGSGTAYVILDGETKQSHTIADRNTRKRLIAPCNGNRLSMRITGSGPATVYQMEIE